MQVRLFGRYQSGVAAVELGLLLLPLVTLVFGVTELGRAIYQYNTIAKSVRTAARFLSQYEAGDGKRAGQARCLVVYGNIGTLAKDGSVVCSGAELAPGLAAATTTVEDAKTPGANLEFEPIRTPDGTQVGITNLVRVTVSNYQFNSLVSFVVPTIVFDPISATMTQAIP